MKDFSKDKLKTLAPLLVSGIAQVVLGGIGLWRTIGSYGRVSALLFCVYLVISLTIMVCGIILCAQSPKITDTLDEERRHRRSR